MANLQLLQIFLVAKGKNSFANATVLVAISSPETRLDMFNSFPKNRVVK